MIISRTPFRISFVGGGTDLEDFYAIEDGKVLSTSIDKFVYVAVKRQIDIVDHKYRITWSKAEFKDRIDDIEHPIVREALKIMEVDYPLEVTTFADIPANTGLGSSSAFAVGLLHALFALQGRMVTKSTLASMAAHIEIDILKRHIGKQDHYAVTYGNMNVLTFHKSGTVSIDPVLSHPDFKQKIQNNLMLFYSGFKRDASEVLEKQKKKIKEKFKVLQGMKDLVDPLNRMISSGTDENQFGTILHKGWEMKRSLTAEISSREIDNYYQKALDAGAIGGKILGAGGGGFLLFYAEQKYHEPVTSALSNLYRVKFKFDDAGTRITYYDQGI
ncbi:MAG: hypothetical protein ABII23_07060 [bacterium]